jgi:hypothetical protein
MTSFSNEVLEADIALLMPQTNPAEYGRVAERYAGLVGALADKAVSAVFTYQQGSYHPELGGFRGVFDRKHNLLAEFARVPVVRDLTNQESYDQPLYAPESGLRIVNNRETSELLRDGLSLADFGQIDTREPGLVVPNMFRMISIGNKVIGAVQYTEVEEPTTADSTRKDYKDFINPSELPEELRLIAAGVHAELVAKTGSGQNVIAVDVMNGVGEGGEAYNRFKVLRKPLRISQWDLKFYGEHSAGSAAVKEIAGRWDEAEATLLADVVAGRDS